jgi:hypothetical protein
MTQQLPPLVLRLRSQILERHHIFPQINSLLYVAETESPDL